MNRTLRSTVAYLSIAVTLLLLVMLSGCSCTPQVSTNSDELERQESGIRSMLYIADNKLYWSVSLEETVDEEGNPYYIGVLDDELDGLLDDLVGSYNTDPSTSVSISAHEVRQGLTADIVEMANQYKENAENGFISFLEWTAEPAELVYRGYMVDTDGTEHFEGESGPSNGPNNYGLERAKDYWLKNFKRPWE